MASTSPVKMETDETKASSSGLEFKLHPLVLINISDHYTRVRMNSDSSGPDTLVMGCIIGSLSGRTVDIANSFELKYDMDDGNLVIDSAFMTRRRQQYTTVFKDQDVVGWYATGSGLSEMHSHIQKSMQEINESPIFLLLDPKLDYARNEIPVKLYETEVHVVDGTPTQEFVATAYTLATSDAERIGVDQVAKVLPSGNSSTSGSELAAHLNSMFSAINMLHTRVKHIHEVLQGMQSGAIPSDRAVLRKVNRMLQMLPAMDNTAFRHDWFTEYNANMLSCLLCTMTQGTAQVDDLVEKHHLTFDKSMRRRGVF